MPDIEDVALLTNRQWVELLEQECQAGRLESVRTLVPYFRSLCPQSDGCLNLFYSVLVSAARRNQTVIARYILDEGVPLTAASVQAAAEAGSIECLDIFLRRGWNVNQALRPDYPPVLAAAVRHRSAVQFLLHHRASPNTRCELDKTPFSLALEDGSRAVIDLMLEHGADINQGEVIHHAIHRKPLDTELLDILIEKGAPFDCILYSGNRTEYERNMSAVGLGTQLHHAIIGGNSEAVRYLVDRGSSLDKTTIYGTAAHQFAVETNASPLIMNMLREAYQRQK